MGGKIVVPPAHPHMTSPDRLDPDRATETLKFVGTVPSIPNDEFTWDIIVEGELFLPLHDPSDIIVEAIVRIEDFP